MEELLIRPFTEQDAGATAAIFFDAVRSGSREFYSDAQRQAWAPAIPPLPDWLDRLKAQTTLVAEQVGDVVGFMTLDGEGYIDLVFVAPDLIGKGVARQLYAGVENVARKAGIQKLSVQASHMARRFFERQGWSVVRQQTVTLRGVALTNFVMEKHLV